jgi:L-iditol 2-dehydrogenase
MVEPGVIEYRDIPPPLLGAGQVLVEMKRIGVCGSDIHVYHGLHPYTTYPRVQGHEVSGIVADLGHEVDGLSIGDVVTIIPQETCGECYPCRHGMYHICESLKVLGFQTEGTAQEYYAADADKVLKIPDGITLDHAAMIEPIAVAVHALGRGGDVAGKNVLVLGAGTIGNLVAQSAKALGAEASMVTDLQDYRLEKALACGIDFAINPTSEDLSAAIARDFGPDRADLILECVGAQETIDDAIDNARKGTTIVVVGVFGEKPRVDLGLVQDRELSLVGTLMYQKPDWGTAIELVAGGKMHLDPMVTHHVPFDEFLSAYELIEAARGESLKVMVTLP